jgi:plastocyanin
MTDDDRLAPRPRESLLVPLVIPLGILVVIGLVLWGFSRVLLHLKPHVATATALVVAAAIVAIVASVASRKRVGNGSLLSVAVGVVGVGMLASGAALLVGAAVEEPGPAATIALTAPAGAASKGFAEKSLSAPADQPFIITFDNQDQAMNHNVVIASDDPAKDPTAQTFFTGALVLGPGQASYAITPLAEGTYYFFCEVHPTTMNGSLSVAPAPPPGEGPAQPSTGITASGLAFDTSTLTFVADQKISFDFQNDDAAPHDLAIFTDSSATDALFTGPTVDPGTSKTLEIPPLKPGSYYFHCNFHPETMFGTVTVVPASEEPPPNGGSSGPPPSGEPPPSGSP